MKPMTSISAWGTLPSFALLSVKDRKVIKRSADYKSMFAEMKGMVDMSKRPEERSHVLVCMLKRLDSAIGVSVVEDGTMKVAVLFCNPMDRFYKRTAYILLKKKLETDSPNALLWKGKFLGEKPVAEAIRPITQAFKLSNASLLTPEELGSAPKGDVFYTRFRRDGSIVSSVVRTAILQLLKDLESKGVVKVDDGFTTLQRLWNAEEELACADCGVAHKSTDPHSDARVEEGEADQQ